MSNKTALPPELITEETIATLYDHYEIAIKRINALLDSPAAAALTQGQINGLQSCGDGWRFCTNHALQGLTPYRER